MGMLDHVGTGDYTIPDRLDAARTDLRDEFMADPLGRHGEELQLVLGLLRGSFTQPRWVLVTVEPGRSWVIAQAPRRRGEPLSLHGDTVFTDRADAERHVFDLRWQALSSGGAGA